MKKLMIVAAVAALFAGCLKDEAERFGYKGADLADDDKMFFTTGQGVTNWVPSRVLSVCEEYPMSPDETALIAAAGVVAPGEPLEKVPAGYEKSTEEPWFVTWTKKGAGFGREGVNGFISHWNEDKKVWETSETYFSSYYPDEAGALAALAETRKVLSETFSPKKFYDFDRCWVAEYLRIRVMCLVGQKSDGTWSCMLDINDKCRTGCGQWEPVEVQAERLAEYKYRKALSAWKSQKSEVIEKNHAAVEKIRAEKGLVLLGDGSRQFDADDGRKAYFRSGACEASFVTNRLEFWKEKADLLAAATGVVFESEPTTEEIPCEAAGEASCGYVVMYASAESDIYEVRLNVAFPLPAETEKATEQTEGKAEEDDAGKEPAPKPMVEWREICIEKMQPGLEIPPRPRPPRR